MCPQEPLALLQGWVHDFEALQLRHSPATLTSLIKVQFTSASPATVLHQISRIYRIPGCPAVALSAAGSSSQLE